MKTIKAVAAHLARVCRHKWYVYQAGRALGLPIGQLLAHDLSKFSPLEIRGYSGKFHDGPAAWKDEFPAAWAHHWHCNPHHIEYWRDFWGNPAWAIMMPDELATEMVADWFAACREYEGYWPMLGRPWPWLENHGYKLIDNLAVPTREIVQAAVARGLAWSTEKAIAEDVG